MCGLAGIFDPLGGSQGCSERALIEQMTALLEHRGPDEGGTHLEPGLALGHRRLSIIDLTSGQQPLGNEDGSVLTVYNGEIYNHAELRAELAARGHQFRTCCDTEVIVHAWEEWGEGLVGRLRGMFALAVWDRRRGQLFLARDRLGIKPLYYAALADGRLLFASEVKSLLACPELPRDIDTAALEEYFAFGYVPDPRSIFTAVRKLSPGYTLTVARGQLPTAPQPYWDVAMAPGDPAHSPSFAEHAEELATRLGEAVGIRMIADVPLGAFLSGGVDSSTVVALMSEASHQPVTACSIAFAEQSYDESEYARVVARHLGLHHHVDEVSSDRFELVDELARLFDEPFADPSALPTYEVSRMARRHVTVALSGDGGDELLAGYRRYRGYAREERLRDWLPDSLRRGLFGPLAQLYPKADWAPQWLRAKATLQALAADPVGGYLRSVAVVDDSIRARLFSAGMRRDLQGYHGVVVLRRQADAQGWGGKGERLPAGMDPIAFVQYLDLKTWLPGDILTKVDRASMAHGLEVRVPLLDHQFVEWAARLPSAHKFNNREGKRILKHFAQTRVPPEVINRRKRGFDMPIADWLRGPLRGELRRAVLGERLADSGFFDPAVLQRLVDDHQGGRSNHARPLWALLMFEAFLRRVAESAPEASA